VIGPAVKDDVSNIIPEAGRIGRASVGVFGVAPDEPAAHDQARSKRILLL
jgi:hypothetical protein